MMPGETHSKTAGIASEAAGSCQNCTSLQQSLNEYVAALIALKQKIIDSDQLLTEYQRKCDDLQYAERENETLRCQLEQMLQKISPQEQHEKELKFLKAELEEKMSTLKIYQQTEMEYIKVKEECEKSNIAKKKLEAKLKKMEEAAAKHEKDYKQLKMEKKVIGNELKKIRKKLDGFQSEKSKKVIMKNAQIQVAREKPFVKLDKQKIKYLLEEIWGCIESSTENGDFDLLMLGNVVNQLTVPEIKVNEKKRRGRKCKSTPECSLSPRHNSLVIGQAHNTLAELAPVQASLNLTDPNNSPHVESAVAEVNEVSAFNEDVLVPKDLSDCSSVNSGFESDMNEMCEVQDWAKPLPNLLSPIQCSPLTMKNVFGEFTDSSDAESTSEMDQYHCVSQLRPESTLNNGTDKNSNSNEEVEHIFVAADNVAIKAIDCSNDSSDLSMETEINMHDLEQITPIVPMEEAQAVTEVPVLMECEDRSDHLTNGTTCSKDTLFDTLKSPEPKFQNPEFCERPLAEIENVAMSLDAENDVQDTACHADKDALQLDNSVFNSTTSKMTTSCSQLVHLSEQNDTVGEIKFNNLTDDNHESSGCFIANKSLMAEDQSVENNLNPDKDACITTGRNVSLLSCDQESVLHMQSENCSENKNSSTLMDLHTKQKMSDDGNLLSKDANNVADVDLSRCSAGNLEKPDTMSTFNLINTFTEETGQRSNVSTGKNYLESTLKPLEQSQPSEPSRQTSALLSNHNQLSTVSDCRVHGIDLKNIKETSISDKTRQMDKAHETSHEAVADTMATFLNKHNSSTVASMECKPLDKKDDVLEKCSLQKEKIFEHKPEQQICSDLVVHQMASTSIFHNKDNQYERSLLEDGDHSSPAVGLNGPLASPVDQRAETELQSSLIDTCNQDYACSPNLVICDDDLTPPSTVQLNGMCTPCIKTSTDSSSSGLVKPNHLHFNLPSVVSSSPVHMVVDSEPQKEGDITKTQCEEVTQSKESAMDVNSSSSEERNSILCPLSPEQDRTLKAKISSKVLPVVPLEELQHLHKSSESNDSLKKLENNTSDTCDVSLDSESEYEFPVRKVNVTWPALYNPFVRNESYKTASDASKGDNPLIIVTELEQHKPPSLAHVETEGHAATVSKPLNDSKVENDILKESEHSELHTLDTESKNGVTSEGNAVECFSDGISKNISSMQEPVRQNDVSDHIHFDNYVEKNIRNNAETGGQRNLPGKNLIWNFSRHDDFVDPREVLTRKQKADSENVSAHLENSISKGCVSTGKTREPDTSNKLKSSSFQTVKENSANRLPCGGTVSLNAQGVQTILANADTSTNTGHSPETINKVRSEMGPPLPPLLGPLLSTPPRSVRTLSPIMSSSSRSSLPSPLDDVISPLPGTPFPPLMSPLCDGRKRKSPVCNTPSPAEKANRRILSSPLQFCAATPKHAVPVPGRLPLSANGGSACNVQENSVKILDTMYPELSARARTLNILKGNVQLNRGISGDGQNVPVSQITGFKSITSTSTVFIKTGSNSKTSNLEKPNTSEAQLSSESCTSGNKRARDSFQMPKSAKRLRLDSESPVPESVKGCFRMPAKNQDEKKPCQNFSYCESLPDIVKDSSVDEDIITNALKKIEELCFDLLPVIRSHVHVGTIPNVPVMRNEEKEVIYDFSSLKKGLADRFLHVLLKKIKTGKRSLDSAYLQALCRVYVGLCRQLGDIERARILCYNILKEDFPDPDKLLLFVVSSWNDILSLHGVVSKAIQAVLKILAKEDVGSCLNAYLNWEKSPPMNISVLLNSVLMAIQLYPDVKFHQSEKYGEDLTDNVWEYVFAVDLLCSHRKWIWTHENVISKELWPILDKWVKRKKGNLTLQFVPDIIVATVLRLIGRLCQIGLKEGFITAVKNITSVIITFIKHAHEEGVPWGVQLASVYMLCDTAPCDPTLVHQTIQAWKESTENDIPQAVINFMQEIASLCVQDT